MLSGGVYMAAHLPRHPPLTPAVVLLAAGGALTIAAVVLLSRVRPFAWETFFLVARWALLAYAVIAGILGFVFIYDHTRGATLTVLVLTLVVFALDVPDGGRIHRGAVSGDRFDPRSHGAKRYATVT